MSKLIDLTGRVFGRLTVIKRGRSNHRGAVYWVCDCSCGIKGKEVQGGTLKAGKTISCGCYHTEVHTGNKHNLIPEEDLTDEQRFKVEEVMLLNV